jgi:hypothetical protein
LRRMTSRKSRNPICSSDFSVIRVSLAAHA